MKKNYRFGINMNIIKNYQKIINSKIEKIRIQGTPNELMILLIIF
ncbi:MAG: hypothetical protein Ct9H90mP3_2120 [Flammeovirgaceae bacterium]|nr:MAG: hypothetical protein Ct9H90mP3_2120 [Flammeovirgaceae bacterium]